MSYILDALRRADAERSRQADQGASDLSAQVTAATPWSGANTSTPTRRPVMPWLLAGLFVAGVALVIGWWMGDQAPTRGAQADASQATAQPAPSSEPTPKTVAIPSEAALAATAAQWPVPASTDTSPPPVLRPEPEPIPAPAPAPMAARAVPPQAENAPPTGPVRPAVPGQDPSVKITGSTYSDNPAHRMLIANGKVVQEGQEIEPGMTLEIITPHSAVINHRGTRFNVNY